MRYLEPNEVVDGCYWAKWDEFGLPCTGLVRISGKSVRHIGNLVVCKIDDYKEFYGPLNDPWEN